jgi:hypothetical protein
MDEKREYHCEVCDAKETLTEQEMFDAGWDYPPRIGTWGVVSPRTCGNCGIEETAWWHLITQGSTNLPEKHQATVRRIISENPNLSLVTSDD